MSLAISRISQYSDVVPRDWQHRSCSVVNLFMVLSFFNATENVTVASLIQEGESIGAYGPHGWIHEGVVRLAHNHGVHAYAQEFRSLDGVLEQRLALGGITKIKEMLTKGFPTIVSIQKENGSYHTVTVVGTMDNGFICHDPELGEALEIPIEVFLKRWRKLAIFFEV
jgi:hypothetical protein